MLDKAIRELDRERNVGAIRCSQCKQSWTTKIHQLSEPIDIYRRASSGGAGRGACAVSRVLGLAVSLCRAALRLP